METQKSSSVSPEQLQHMIAEAAFYRAERQGFQGDPVEDWLQAEVEIEALLQATQEPRHSSAKRAQSAAEASAHDRSEPKAAARKK
jgi:hypothetical protein